MLNPEGYKLFLENNCLLCKKYKGLNDDNCGTNKRTEMSQYAGAGALFPSKDLIKISNTNYACKKIEYKANSKPLVQVSMDPVEKVEKVSQIKMF